LLKKCEKIVKVLQGNPQRPPNHLCLIIGRYKEFYLIKIPTHGMPLIEYEAIKSLLGQAPTLKLQKQVAEAKEGRKYKGLLLII
jgi:hypothetical protein